MFPELIDSTLIINEVDILHMISVGLDITPAGLYKRGSVTGGERPEQIENTYALMNLKTWKGKMSSRLSHGKRGLAKTSHSRVSDRRFDILFKMDGLGYSVPCNIYCVIACPVTNRSWWGPCVPALFNGWRATIAMAQYQLMKSINIQLQNSNFDGAIYRSLYIVMCQLIHHSSFHFSLQLDLWGNKIRTQINAISLKIENLI